jgi:hypothetical protein
MKLIASVRNKETREIEVIEKEYETKKAFERDLKGNGYSIRFIATPEKFDEACYKWYENNEKVKLIEKTRYNMDKEMAEKANMTVSEYRRIFR